MELARFERIHGLAFAGIAVALALLVGEATGAAVIVLLAVAVAVLGVPHGAFDPAVARFKGLWHTPAELALFMGGYAALALLALLFWLLAPPLALALFIAISAIHFSGDWADRLSPPARLAAGVAVVALPSFAHPEAVAEILATIAPGPATDLIVDGLAVAGPAIILALAVLVMRDAAAPGADRREVATAGTELAAIVVLAVATAPLVFFVVYFALLHSLRQTVRTLAATPPDGRRFAVRVMVAVTLLTLVYAGIAWAALPAGVATEAATLQVVFVGLYALTIPHMALAAWPANGTLSALAPPPRRARPR